MGYAVQRIVNLPIRQCLLVRIGANSPELSTRRYVCIPLLIDWSTLIFTDRNLAAAVHATIDGTCRRTASCWIQEKIVKLSRYGHCACIIVVNRMDGPSALALWLLDIYIG